MSLRTRLLVGLAVLVFAAVATAGWSVLAVARAKLQAAEEARAPAVGAQVAALVERACGATCTAPAVTETVAALVEGGAAPEIVAVDEGGGADCGWAKPTKTSATNQYFTGGP